MTGIVAAVAVVGGPAGNPRIAPSFADCPLRANAGLTQCCILPVSELRPAGDVLGTLAGIRNSDVSSR